MKIENIYSDNESQEKLYSVLLSQSELDLFQKTYSMSGTTKIARAIRKMERPFRMFEPEYGEALKRNMKLKIAKNGGKVPEPKVNTGIKKLDNWLNNK